jgi:hypothetical protein
MPWVAADAELFIRGLRVPRVVHVHAKLVLRLRFFELQN